MRLLWRPRLRSRALGGRSAPSDRIWANPRAGLLSALSQPTARPQFLQRIRRSVQASRQQRWPPLTSGSGLPHQGADNPPTRRLRLTHPARRRGYQPGTSARQRAAPTVTSRAGRERAVVGRILRWFASSRSPVRSRLAPQAKRPCPSRFVVRGRLGAGSGARRLRALSVRTLAAEGDRVHRRSRPQA